LGSFGAGLRLPPVYAAAFVNGSTDVFRRIAAASLQNAEAAAQQAIRLDPNNIDGYSGLGLAREFEGKFVQAEDLYKQALSLDPGSPDTLHRYSLVLAIVGRLKDSLALRLRLRAQEPLVPIFNQYTAIDLWLNGRNDEAIAIFKALPPTFFFPGFFLSQVYASMGRYGEAADALREIPSGVIPPGALTETIRLLSGAPAQTAPPQTTLSNGLLGFVYVYAGAPNRVLDLYEGLTEAGEPAIAGVASSLWAPAYSPVRKTDRFKTYARKAGMVDYWRERGWPDLCHPTTGDDFACV
jgi:tetratricopeptide (TPR) repeat protein